MITITGILDKITYQNPDNQYTIARIKTRDVKDGVTVVGYLAGVAQGETLKLKGAWVTHAKYGDQFKVDSYEVTLPASVSGIRRYLASGIIKGIGKSMAEKIVDSFQDRALDIIENEPDRLREISGIGKAKLEQIVRAWNQHHSVRRVMQFLQENEVGVFHASVILKYYGSQAMDILKNSPYALSRDIPEAGFAVADAIALKAGFQRDDPERIKACLVYLLLKSEGDGHVYADRDDLIQRCFQLTSASVEDMDKALAVLETGGEIVCENRDVYLKRLYTAETGIALKLKAMLTVKVSEWGLDRDAITTEVMSRLAVQLSPEQQEVVCQVLAHRVVVITGGPGTGKTTLIRAICAVFSRLRQKILLCAPTGRAARRLSQVTDRKAATLHKLLLYDPESESFARNRSNPLEADVIIADEASMVDTMLMYHLVQAVPVNAVLILVGDIFQLPSVGPGNVLADVINSGSVTVFSLTKIFRQAEQSPIVMNAHCIRRGEMPSLERNPESQGLSEFYFIENTAPQRVVETITELCGKRIRNAFPHIDEIQVLTPMHRGETGTINLNQKLQQVLNDRPGGIEARGFTFKTGDKVMHLKNNYQKEVFNGDIGLVHEVDASENRVSVDYDGRIVDYDILELDELTLAYAISVHKSQGSEYSAVVLAITTLHFPMLQRNLLYTALTRGRDLVILVGSRRAVEIALNNTRTDQRLSRLCRRLETALGGKPGSLSQVSDLILVDEPLNESKGKPDQKPPDPPGPGSEP
ncbi:MAG: ATP-dependent RecD-like DNA helicase [Pseudomonadota bacterium]